MHVTDVRNQIIQVLSQNIRGIAQTGDLNAVSPDTIAQSVEELKNPTAELRDLHMQ